MCLKVGVCVSEGGFEWSGGGEILSHTESISLSCFLLERSRSRSENNNTSVNTVNHCRTLQQLQPGNFQYWYQNNSNKDPTLIDSGCFGGVVGKAYLAPAQTLPEARAAPPTEPQEGERLPEERGTV